MTKVYTGEELWIVIGKEAMAAKVNYDNEIHADGMDLLIYESREAAGQAARDRWEDMARNDPSEFTCMVGESTLVAWALGQYAGPGTSQVKNLEEWLDLFLDAPEEELASYDGAELDVDRISTALCEELGIEPSDSMVAYRTN